MANPPFVNNSFYHIYNRGVEKRNIFMDKWDHMRYLETLDFYRKSPAPMKLSDFRRGMVKLKKIENQTDLIKIYCYCLMPNHFHLLVQQLADGGISEFLRKVADSYTRYFNTKHDRVGSLFQGVFKAKLIEKDKFLLQVSKYIHRNSFTLDEWEGRVYPYSSYSYYLSREPHSFCNIDFILSYFSKNKPYLNYQSFIEEAEMDDSTLFELLIDYND